MLKMDQYRKVTRKKVILYSLLGVNLYAAWCQIQLEIPSPHLSLLMTGLTLGMLVLIIALERSRRQLKQPISWRYWFGINHWDESEDRGDE